VLFRSPEDAFPPADTLLGVSDRPFSFQEFAQIWVDRLPWYYADEPMLRAIFARLEEELQRMQSAVEEVARFILPSRSYGEGLARWERIIGVSSGTDASESERRQVVLGRLRQRTDHSALAFVQVLSRLQGVSVTVEELFNVYTVNLKLASPTPELEGVVRGVIDMIKPAHLELTFGDPFRTDDSLLDTDTV